METVHCRTAARHDATRLVPLLRAAQSGSSAAPEALENLLLALYPVVWRFLRMRLGRWRDADEVTNDVSQETMVRICMAVGQCRADSDRSLTGWACTAAHRTLIDLLRSPASGLMAQQLAVELKTDLGLDDVADTDAPTAAIDATPELSLSPDEARGYCPAESAPRERLLELVVQAYNAVAEETGELLWWRLVMGAEWSEVGGQMSTTTAGAKRRFQRAICTLERAVRELVQALPSVERTAVEALLEHYLAETPTVCDSSSAHTSMHPDTAKVSGRRGPRQLRVDAA